MHALITAIARIMAYIGGAVLSILILITCLSIFGRTLNGWFHAAWLHDLAPGFFDWLLAIGVGPINGDYEIVEAGMAFAVFAFLPLCTLTAGHATVDVFTNWLPDRAQRILRMVVDIAFAVVLVIIAYKLLDGMNSKIRSGQTSFLLQFPVWWGFAASLIGAAVSAVVGIYVALVRVVEAATNRTIIADGPEADH